MASVRLTPKESLTKKELKLFSNSFPQELKELSRARLKSALIKTEALVERYRRRLLKANKTQARVINFRIKKLETTLLRYAKALDKSIESHERADGQKTKSMTRQSKMKLKRNYSPREDFIYKERNKIYAKKVPHSLIKN